jgi:HK97 family phage prohead protease
VTAYRTIHSQVRAAGARTVTLKVITPGVVDDYGSLWNADAFDASLAQRLPTLCWAHDWSDPIGHGLDFTRSADGPVIRFGFDDFKAVPRAAQAYAQAQSGTIQDCSVGFSHPMKRTPTDAELAAYPGVVEVIEQATLDEVSLVLRGAVPGAKVLAVRSRRTSPAPVTDTEILDALAIVNARR